MRLVRHIVILVMLPAIFVACGKKFQSTSGTSSVDEETSGATYSLAGSISGLAGSGLRLWESSTSQTLDITTNGSFTFAGKAAEGTAYEVSISAQPAFPQQTCAIADAKGTVNGDISNIAITCVTATFSVGGTLTGSAGNTITIQLNGGSDVALAADGTYTFPSVTDGTSYTITATSSLGTDICIVDNNTGVVTGANVSGINVTCAPASTISGTIGQSSGNTNGITIHVWAYTANTQILSPVATTTVTVVSGPLAAPGYSLTVATGQTYYLRAFRDGHNPGSANPDNLPTVPEDPQSIVSAGKSGPFPMAGQNITLNDISTTNHRYNYFSAYAYNESAEAQEVQSTPPKNYCRGFHMMMQANFDASSGTLANVTAPRALTPAGDSSLLNDGGCGNGGINPANSYDYFVETSGNYSFSKGVHAPGPALAGKYTFYFGTTGGSPGTQYNYAHMAEYNIPTIYKLSRDVYITNPTGAARNSSLHPTMTWNSVTNATHYQVEMRSLDSPQTYNNYPQVTGLTYTPPVGPSTTLTDDLAYEVTIVPSVQAPYEIARARGIDMKFVTDVDGLSSVTLQGNIINNSGATGRYIITGRGSNASNNDDQASVILDSTATSYSLTVLKASLTGEGAVEGLIDVSGSGETDGGVNSFFRSYYGLNGTLNMSQDIKFNPPINVLSPANSAGGLGTTPVFSWESYAQSAGTSAPTGPWSYMLFVTSINASNGMPTVLWGLPNSYDSLDMASLPADPNKYDIGCAFQGGIWVGASSTCTGPFGSLLNLSAGQVIGFSITNPGSGYTTATAVVSDSGVGAGAAAVVNLNASNQVQDVFITAPGTGYTDLTASVVISGDGSGAAATPLVSSTTWIWSVAVIECNFDDYVFGTDVAPANGNNDYLDCIAIKLGAAQNPDFYALSQGRILGSN